MSNYPTTPNLGLSLPPDGDTQWGQAVRDNFTTTDAEMMRRIVNPLSGLGDLLVGGTAGTPGRLGPGGLGQVLTVCASTGALGWTTQVPYVSAATANQILSNNGVIPTWVSASIVPSPGGAQAGYLLSNNGSTAQWVPSPLPASMGASGQFLQSNGAAGVWASIAQVPAVAGHGGSVLTTDGASFFWTPAALVPAVATGNAGMFLGTADGRTYGWMVPPSGFQSPLTTDGDLLAQIGTAAARLPIGTLGQVLTVVSVYTGQTNVLRPVWATPSTMTNPMTGPGDLVYGAAGGMPTRLPGASGVLVNNGTTPSWVQYFAVAAINAGSSGLFLSNNGSTTQWVSLPTGLPAMSSVTTGMILANNGTVASWVQAPQGFANPMTAAGDLLGANAGGSPARISIGAAGTVLTSVNGAPTWQTPASPFPAVAGNGGAFLCTDGSAVTWAMLSQVPGISGAAGMFLGATSTGYAWLALPNQVPSTSGQSGKFLQAGASGGMSWVPIIALPDPTNHSGQVLTTDGGSVFWVAQAAQTTLGTTPLSYTTSSINPGAGATFAVNTTCLIAQVIKIAASAPCRVRVYGTAAAAAADYSRPVSQDPGTVNVGIYAEFVFTGAVLALVCSPIPTCCNLDATPATTLYLTVENTGTTAAAITITATLLKME